MPRLVVEKGPDKGKTVPILPKGTVLVGRDSSAGLPLRDAMTSRLHFKIESREDGFWLCDLESLNGTLLNGAPIKESRIGSGDLVTVGETLLSFVSDGYNPAELSGQRIGGYRILERVGRGGMGTVYKAEQVDLQRIVALKTLSEEYVKDKDYIDLFIHEARAAAKLNHSNIVQVYDVKRVQNLYYISMEFMAGGSVQELLGKQHKLPLDETLRIVLDAARGLEHAHRKGIVHRDVKPDNLMLSEAGMTKVGDMGLARGLKENVGPQEGAVVIGTPHYIAPEQVLGQAADFLSDIYALGATTYRMLAGVTPFTAPSVRDLVRKKTIEDPTPLHEVDPEIPRRVSGIVVHMMARDPRRRPPAMGDVISALEQWRGEEGGARAHGENTTPIDHFAGNKKLLLSALGLLIAVVILGVCGAILLRKDAASSPAALAGGGAAEDRERGLQLLELRERQDMNRRDPESLKAVISEYRAFEARYAGSPQASRAGERRSRLEIELRQVQAERRLGELEFEDTANWNHLQASFQQGRLQLEYVLRTQKDYEELAETEAYRGTRAAEQAAARALHIRKWCHAVEVLRKLFEETRARARELADRQRFGEARRRLVEFQDRAKRDALDCPFAPDRYRALLYEVPAEQEAREVTDLARAQWNKVDGEARSRADPAEAIRLLAPLLRDSVDEVVEEAQGLKRKLEVAWADRLLREEEERDRLRAEALKRALETFEIESAAVREMVTRFDFRAASVRMKAFLEKNTAEELKPRLERRTRELERAAHFMMSLVAAIKDRDSTGANHSGFKTDFRVGHLECLIKDADETSMQLAFLSGGTQFYRWSQFKPVDFYRFVKSNWKHNLQQQNKDLTDLCDLACVLMEFGLYGEALDEIRTVQKSGEFPRTAEANRLFCAEYEDRIEKGDSSEHEEIEARKRLARLGDLMMASQYDRARLEIGLLRGRYGKTRAVIDAEEILRKHQEKIDTESSKDEKQGVREDLHRRILAHVAEAAAAARQARDDIAVRLGRIPDPLERNILLGSAYATCGDWGKSTERLLEAKKLVDPLLVPGRIGEENLQLMATVYANLYRNFIVQKMKRNADAIRNEGSRLLANQKKAEPEGWVKWRDHLMHWGDDIYPEQQKLLEGFKEDLRAVPDDPQRIWDLALCYMDGLRDFAEARGYLTYLFRNHQEFPPVSKGECLWRLAEIHYAALEIGEALRLYKELRDQLSANPEGVDQKTMGLVTKRIAECYNLLLKMGYSYTEPQ